MISAETEEIWILISCERSYLWRKKEKNPFTAFIQVQCHELANSLSKPVHCLLVQVLGEHTGRMAASARLGLSCIIIQTKHMAQICLSKRMCFLSLSAQEWDFMISSCENITNSNSASLLFVYIFWELLSMIHSSLFVETATKEQYFCHDGILFQSMNNQILLPLLDSASCFPSFNYSHNECYDML